MDPIVMPLYDYPLFMAMSASVGNLVANDLHDGVRTRFAVAVLYGYTIGGYTLHNWTFAFALIVGFYGGAAIKHSANRKEHPPLAANPLDQSSEEPSPA